MLTSSVALTLFLQARGPQPASGSLTQASRYQVILRHDRRMFSSQIPTSGKTLHNDSWRFLQGICRIVTFSLPIEPQRCSLISTSHDLIVCAALNSVLGGWFLIMERMEELQLQFDKFSDWSTHYQRPLFPLLLIRWVLDFS
jgi:hypothetical protein